MNKLIFKKNDINTKELNAIIKDYCENSNILTSNLFNIQLICEEFLFNILFPNYSGEVEFSVMQENNLLIMRFIYDGEDYLNKINNSSFLSLKLIKSKSRKIESSTENKKTTVEFHL